MPNELLITAGTSNVPLATKMAENLKKELLGNNLKRFSDGEIWLQYDATLRGKDVFIIQSTDNSDAIMELLILIDAAKRAKAKRVIVVIPYFGYSRQDKKDEPRVPFSAALMCHLIEVAGADAVILAELHNHAMTGFFSNKVHVDHLYLTQEICPCLTKIKNLIVMPTDAGGSKMARYYASKLKADRASADKIRDGHNKVKEIRIIGDVSDKNVLIVDDIADTCGTLEKAILSVKQGGGLDVYFSCVHGVISGRGPEVLTNNPDIKGVYLTDTLDLSKKNLPRHTHIIPSADVFSEAIEKFHLDESIDSLFEQNKIMA